MKPPSDNSNSMDRRNFLRLTGATALIHGGLLSATRSHANDITTNPAALYQQVIPGNKGLAANWVRSLLVRDVPDDAPITCSDKKHLAHIGMTVGGIGAGTMYLTGDGRLAVWDIFNQHHEGVVPNRTGIPSGMENLGRAGSVVRERDGANFVNPPTLESHPLPFRQSFAIESAGTKRALDASGFESVTFRGDWPVGRVKFSDPTCPFSVELAAWSPFIPLDVENSTLPMTMMEYTVENHSTAPIEAFISGTLQNPVLHRSAQLQQIPPLQTTVLREVDALMLAHGVSKPENAADNKARPQIVFDDFERDTHAPWVAEGNAFGNGPIAADAVPKHQGDLGIQGNRALNSHASAPGGSVNEKDAATGTLTSPEFTIQRHFINMLLGGGNHPGKTGVELLVDGKVVASVSGRNTNQMRPASIDARPFAGKSGRLRIIDRATGGWGNVGVDQIIFSDQAAATETPENQGDFGTIVLAALDQQAATAAAPEDGQPETLRIAVALAPGEKRRVSFLLAWHFPNLAPLPGIGKRRPHYATRFEDARAVARDAIGRLDSLRERTFAWVETWYDSTLPRWLMDRAILTANTLQTSNCFLLDDQRFWAWEGVGCCPGTCNHVWHYAQSIARLFPPLERSLREMVDFRVALNPDGGVRYRGEAGGTIAVDGQAAIVLRTWREHLCSQDDSFLKRVWPGAKQALEWLIRFDQNDPDGADGLLHGRQHNTLDANWYGKVHCLNSLYLAALRAGQAMATEIGDASFAAQCHKLFKLGSKNIETLFNGEYYIQIEDPKHQDAIGVGPGCYIDQVIGQWWATQTGLGRLYNADQIRSALHSLWKYNFVPHIDTFRQTFKRGRFYALDDEAGLIMCSWPKGGLRKDFMRHWQYGYFNECMTGFEYQAAAHMVQEGAPLTGDPESLETVIEDSQDPRALTLRGLAITRAIHDRYAPSKRNPYNEIECSDHYARAAAGYSVFLATCGFHHHGPKCELGFAPKISPEDFIAPFITAAAWGVFRQRIRPGKMDVSIKIRHGALKLTRLQLAPGWQTTSLTARLDEATPPAILVSTDQGSHIEFNPAIEIKTDEILEITLT